MTEEAQALGDVKVSVDRLSGKIDHLDTSVRWSRIREIALIGVVIAVCVALILGAVAVVSVRHENRCIAVFAAATADRTGVLAPLSTDRNNAQDARQDAEANLILTLIPNPGTNPAGQHQAFVDALQAFHAAAQTYDKANQAYQQAYSAHPPPAAPSYSC